MNTDIDTRNVLLAIDIEASGPRLCQDMFQIGGNVRDVKTGEDLHNVSFTIVGEGTPEWDDTRFWFEKQNGRDRLHKYGYSNDQIDAFFNPLEKDIKKRLPVLPEKDSLTDILHKFMNWYHSMHEKYNVLPISDYPEFDVGSISAAIAPLGYPHLGFVKEQYKGGWYNFWTHMKSRNGNNVRDGESVYESSARIFGFDLNLRNSHNAVDDASDMTLVLYKYLKASGDQLPEFREKYVV